MISIANDLRNPPEARLSQRRFRYFFIITNTPSHDSSGEVSISAGQPFQVHRAQIIMRLPVRLFACCSAAFSEKSWRVRIAAGSW